MERHYAKKRKSTGDNSEEKGKIAPKRFKLNVGGTKYEVSDSLLDQFQDSMLRRITSDTWNDTDVFLDPDQNQEIFIERDGARFQFVLDYMRDGKVVIPLSVPRTQLISDMEYYGIDFNESQIILNVADPKDLFYELATYRDFFQSTQKEIDARYQKIVVEKVACTIASKYFETLMPPATARENNPSKKANMPTEPDSSFFKSKSIEVKVNEDNSGIEIKELQPFLNRYGLEATATVNGWITGWNGGTLKVSVKLLSSSRIIGMEH